MDYLNVPIELFLHRLTKGGMRQFQTYLYMKSVSGGYFYDKEIDGLCQALGYKTKKTFHNHIQKLIKERLVYVNSKKGCICVRSFEEAVRLQGLRQTKLGVIVYKSDISKAGSYGFAALWERCVRRSCYRSKALNGTFSRSEGHSLSYISMVTRNSKSTTYRRRKKCEELGLMQSKQRFERVCPKKEANMFRASVENSRPYVIKGDYLCRQLKNETSCFVCLRKKRNQ